MERKLEESLGLQRFMRDVGSLWGVGKLVWPVGGSVLKVSETGGNYRLGVFLEMVLTRTPTATWSDRN